MRTRISGEALVRFIRTYQKTSVKLTLLTPHLTVTDFARFLG